MEQMYLTIRQKETGNRIKSLLDQKGYTVRDVQEAMGFANPQAVYKWLAGQSLPSIDNFLILSELLDTTIEEILVVDRYPRCCEKGRRNVLPVLEEKGCKRILIQNLFGAIPEFFREIHCSWQRCKKGYCYRDLWNLDVWFLRIMPKMLEEFLHISHGFPGKLLDKYAGMENSEELADAEWREIIQKMIFLFHEANEETCQRKNPYQETDKKYLEEEERLEEYRMKCKDEAFKLFSEWFYSLWD